MGRGILLLSVSRRGKQEWSRDVADKAYIRGGIGHVIKGEEREEKKAVFALLYGNAGRFGHFPAFRMRQ